MSESAKPQRRGRVQLEKREIGRIVGADPGPTLIIVCGIHGNEHAGIESARRVFARIEQNEKAKKTFRGELVVFAGNVAALRAGIRYHAKDLNRVWTEDQVRDLGGKRTLDPEDQEQVELLAAIESAIGRSRGKCILGDFHTTSAEGIPFILFGDTIPQRRFGRVFPIPVVIGLEEQLDGVLSSFWTKRNIITFGCEGGQHDDPQSVDALEAVLWIALRGAGLLRQAAGADAELTRAKALLEKRRAGLPRVLEVISRHAISEADQFKMEPGFRNLDHAPSGTLLARDKRGEIRAPKDGMVILPLYQGLGADGFFWGRAVTEARMLASELLRFLEIDRALEYLPGVNRDEEERLVLHENVTKLVPIDVFHVFGYRRVRKSGSRMTVERQPG
jgi:succinylglutamate desuccinylase